MVAVGVKNIKPGVETGLKETQNIYHPKINQGKVETNPEKAKDDKQSPASRKF